MFKSPSREKRQCDQRDLISPGVVLAAHAYHFAMSNYPLIRSNRSGRPSRIAWKPTNPMEPNQPRLFTAVWALTKGF